MGSSPVVVKKLTVIGTKSSIIECEKMPKKELKKLSTTTRDLFNFVSEFGKLHGGRDEINP